MDTWGGFNAILSAGNLFGFAQPAAHFHRPYSMLMRLTSTLWLQDTLFAAFPGRVTDAE